MFDDYNDNEEFWNRITLRFTEGGPNGISKEVEITLRDKESYPEILQQMTYFLQAVGYTYIGGLVAVNDDGEDLKSSLDD